MADDTYYSLLEVSEKASAAEIKSGYLRMIRDVHPDRLANAPAYWQRQAEEKSKEINEAFAVLSNSEKRRLYDAQLDAYRTSRSATSRQTTSQGSTPSPSSSTKQQSQTSARTQSTPGSGTSSTQKPRSASQPHQAASNTPSPPSQPFHSKIGERERFFFALIGSIFAFGSAVAFWGSSSIGEDVFTFLLATILWFGIACLYQPRISKLLYALRVKQPKAQLWATLGIISLALIAGKNTKTQVSAPPMTPGRPTITNSISATPNPGHVLASDGKRGHPAWGYNWVNPSDPKNLDVKLKTGIVLDKDGKFAPARGYEWVNPSDPNNLGVKLETGIVLDKEGKFEPARGYDWANPSDPNNLDVKLNTEATSQEQPVAMPNRYQLAQPVGPAQARIIGERTSIPANADLDYTGHSWICNRGYRQQGHECVPVGIPANADLDYTGHSWICNRGYRQQGYECVQVGIPANADLDYTGHSWICNRGYRQQGQGCVQVGIPANADLDYTGHSWTCNRGYRPQGYECVQVGIPANADLDYTGHSWTCNRGYRQQGQGCVPVGVSTR